MLALLVCVVGENDGDGSFAVIYLVAVTTKNKGLGADEGVEVCTMASVA